MAQPPFCSSPSSSSSSFPRRPPPSSSLPLASPPPSSSSRSPRSPRGGCAARRRAVVAAASSLHLGPAEIAELARNKVLIAATVASAIGQLSKPFTSGKNGGSLNLRTAFRSGGMPSTHSAGVVAVATSLGLERGFADSVFGMSVVFAAIVIYDAQGVRREVGNHAKVLNGFLALREKTGQNSEVDMAAVLISVPEEAVSSSCSSVNPSSGHSSMTGSRRWNTPQSSELEITELNELKQAYIDEGYRLSESVGHTELQVAVGALLGFVVSLVVYAIL